MVKRDSWILYLVSFLLLAVFLQTGFILAHHRPLWNDEIYTQNASIRMASYLQILSGRVGEGNTTPLFYLIQKGICDLFHFSTPPAWVSGQWGVRDAQAEIFLRINPVLFMSLSMVAIFFFFARNYSFLAGLLSVFVSLSSYMVWFYWAEARPYALWFFLTTLQSLVFIHMFMNKRKEPLAWNSLVVIHLLLALTSIFSLIQIVWVSGLLWLFLEKRLARYLSLTVVPGILCLYYYAMSPKYDFWFSLRPEQIIRECFSRDRIYILMIYAFFVGVYFLGKKSKNLNIFKDDSILKGVPYLLFTAGMLLSAMGVLIIFTVKDSHGASGFPVSTRYFIYLTPVAIISTTFFILEILKAVKYRWMQIIVFCGMSYFLVFRFLKIASNVKGMYPLLFIK